MVEVAAVITLAERVGPCCRQQLTTLDDSFSIITAMLHNVTPCSFFLVSSPVKPFPFLFLCVSPTSLSLVLSPLWPTPSPPAKCHCFSKLLLNLPFLLSRLFYPHPASWTECLYQCHPGSLDTVDFKHFAVNSQSPKVSLPLSFPFLFVL